MSLFDGFSGSVCNRGADNAGHAMAKARQNRVTVVSHAPSETQRLGMWVGRRLKPGDVVCLKGDMGTGKTLFTRGIATGLGVPRAHGVRSPTFTLMHEYTGRYRMFHLDLYRIRQEKELEEIGWDEYLYGGGVIVIETAEKIAEVRLPEDRLEVVLERGGVRDRRLTLVGYGPRFESLVTTLAKQRQ